MLQMTRMLRSAPTFTQSKQVSKFEPYIEAESIEMGLSLMQSYTQYSDPTCFICNQTKKARHPKVIDVSRNPCFPAHRQRLFLRRPGLKTSYQSLHSEFTGLMEHSIS